MTFKLRFSCNENSLLTSQFVINLTAKLKGLSERGLRFVGDKAKTIGQPTPDSHPHLMEEDESKCCQWYSIQFTLTQCTLSTSTGPLKIKCRAVTNFSSRRGILKSSRGTKKVWCYSRRLLLSGGGGEGGGVVVRWRLRV